MKRYLLGMGAGLLTLFLPACTTDGTGFSNFTADFVRAVLAASVL